LARRSAPFITLASKDEWANAIFNVSDRFPGAKPWATWAVGELKDATALSDATHEEYLARMDELGVEIYLELWPGGADVPSSSTRGWRSSSITSAWPGCALIWSITSPKLTTRPPKRGTKRIKAIDPKYRLMLKHWEENHMPPTYRGKGDLIFVNTSSEAVHPCA
jgi:hypothetical protein